jgi:hypothetical protein
VAYVRDIAARTTRANPTNVAGSDDLQMTRPAQTVEMCSSVVVANLPAESSAGVCRRLLAQIIILTPRALSRSNGGGVRGKPQLPGSPVHQRCREALDAATVASGTSINASRSMPARRAVPLDVPRRCARTNAGGALGREAVVAGTVASGVDLRIGALIPFDTMRCRRYNS